MSSLPLPAEPSSDHPASLRRASSPLVAAAAAASRMLTCLDVGWRVLATALCFLVFGISTVALGLLVFPFFALVTPDVARRQALSKRVLRFMASAFVRLMRVAGVLSIEVRGAHKLRRHGLLVAANHPTLIDALLLMSLLQRPDCVVKASLATGLATRGPVRAAAYLLNGPVDTLIAQCIASVESGNDLMIFPEGTRTPRTGEIRLRQGAAAVAVCGAIPLTPVHIACSPPTLRKGEPWYRVPPRRPRFVITVGDDLQVDPTAPSPIRSRSQAGAARGLTDRLAGFYRDAGAGSGTP